jgi:hypothetical protein
VRKYFAKAAQIFFGICVGAFFINIGLNMYATLNKMFELQMLSIINMMLLSFVLLREPNQKAE